MMKKKIQIAILALLTLGGTVSIQAGNPQRAGQSGAMELLINPWSRSSGFGGVNSASVRGIEASFLNVAGTAFTEGTEVVFSHTNWFGDADISINAAGLTQRVGDNGVLGVSLMSMNFGEIEITTVENPDGGLGTYSPQYINMGISYAQKFTENIHGGVNIKLINEALPDANALGIAFDAGVQYVTGDNDEIKFGIALRNVGPPMRFSGDGLAFKLNIFNMNGNYTYTAEQRSNAFELPSQLNIGGSYDFLFNNQRLTVAGNFTSNSFTKDQFGLGLEWAFKEYLMIRGAYVYEDGIIDAVERTTIFSGLNMGATFEVPLGSGTFGIDYAYRHTTFMGGINSIGARLSL
jgi:hypothetical protein